MRSSWLLIKMFRWRLAGAVGLIASGTLVVSGVLLLIPTSALDEFAVLGAEHAGLSLGFHIMYLSAVLAVFLTWGMKMHQRLHELPFPVTARQMAYVPLAVAILLWALGLGCVTGILIAGSATKGLVLADWAQFWRDALGAVPITAAILVVSLVAIGGRSQYTFFLWYLPILPMHYRPESMPWARSVVEAYPLWWPVLPIVSLFLLRAMPRHVAEMRSVFVARAVGPFRMAVRDWSAPVRMRRPSVLSQFCAEICLLALALIFFRSSGSEMEFIPHELGQAFFFLLVGCLVAGSVLIALAWLSQLALANSLKPGGLAIGIAMRAAAFGLSKKAAGPTIDICPRCLKHVFVWHSECPHCGQVQPASMRSGDTPEPQPLVRGGRWFGRLLMGAFLPVMVPLLAWKPAMLVKMAPVFLAMLGHGMDPADDATSDRIDALLGGPFTQDYVSIDLSQVASGEERDKVLHKATEILTAEPKPLAWLRAMDTETLDTGAIPERFRIEAIRADDEHLVILALGLRWDRPDALAEGLAQSLVRRLSREFTLDLQMDSDYSYSREDTAYFARASFLDNRVHWVDPENASRCRTSPAAQVVPGFSDAQVYVSLANTSGNCDGASWATAYATLQEGIDAAEAHQVAEVWVARGTYAEHRCGNGSLLLKPGVHVYGGFAGTETSRDERDWTANVTVIDGSTARNGQPAHHVVVGADYAGLDGFTITGGEARRPAEADTPTLESLMASRGGGMLNDGVSPTVANCVFTGNSAEDGGGMHNRDGAVPLVTDCTFTDNEAFESGGGVSNSQSFPTLVNCSFVGNKAEHGGAGVHNTHASTKLTNCTFQGNEAKGMGGGMSSFSSSVELADCVFDGNRALAAGAVYNSGSSPTILACLFKGNSAGCIVNYESTPRLTNCVFWRNTCNHGANAIRNSGASLSTVINCTFAENAASCPKCGAGITSDEESSAMLTNCIVWDESAAAIRGPAIVTNSVVRGGYESEGDSDTRPGFLRSLQASEGNIDADPLFVDPASGDFRLKPESPCVDAGTDVDAAATDLDGQPRPQGAGVDMGAYER